MLKNKNIKIFFYYSLKFLTEQIFNLDLRNIPITYYYYYYYYFVFIVLFILMIAHLFIFSNSYIFQLMTIIFQMTTDI